MINDSDNMNDIQINNSGKNNNKIPKMSIILLMFLIIVILVVTILGFKLNDTKTNFSVDNEQNVIIDENTENNNSNNDSNDSNDNNSCHSTYKAIEYNAIFDITVPDKFIESDFSRTKYFGKEYSHYEYYYNKKSGNSYRLGSCEFELNQFVSGYGSNDNDKAENLAINKNDCFKSVSTEIKEININNIKWYYFEYNFFGTNYSYITEKDGIVYEFEYNINDEKDYEFCKSSLDFVINSIKFK